ncbi:hypothetical protein [Paenibacillus odorifer]|uniref:hypothetical protein n=1 Tax=Paenibacillus odorifer TaxID=189426 RepID=UPI00096E83F6|nr:hypothetical protein [Paenibacillus odorifer]OME55140.1 hypothetical protein BSK61_13820 [Paenibacillus odorifer]
MTQRDWQKDMEFILREKERVQLFKLPTDEEDIAIHWIQEAKERGEREQCLKEAWEQLREIVSTNATGGKGEDINDYDIMLNMMDDLLYLASLYPDTPAPKEGK